MSFRIYLQWKKWMSFLYIWKYYCSFSVLFMATVLPAGLLRRATAKLRLCHYFFHTFFIETPETLPILTIKGIDHQPDFEIS